MSEMSLGYHASHEQFQPRRLLDLVQSAEDVGFSHVLASDHFHPWSERQGESALVWSWLGAAMVTTELDFSTVTAPGYRYHPAVVAQGVGTLRSMFDDRFVLCVGSGQLLNEGITGKRWPTKQERNATLRESVEVMRNLWAGEEVTHDGHITVEQARLFTRSTDPPPVIGAALSTETAAWLGEWADGLITLATPDHEADRERVDAFAERAPDKPVMLKAQLSYANDDDEAMAGAYEQWRTNCIPGTATQEMRTPSDYDELGELIDEETVRENVRVSADLDQHIEWLQEDLDLGADRVYVHNVHPDQDRFIDDFGADVLPAFS